MRPIGCRKRQRKALWLTDLGGCSWNWKGAGNRLELSREDGVESRMGMVKECDAVKNGCVCVCVWRVPWRVTFRGNNQGR